LGQPVLNEVDEMRFKSRKQQAAVMARYKLYRADGRYWKTMKLAPDEVQTIRTAPAYRNIRIVKA